jgi:CRP/FNR family cyclic AMP-dependent transcriptional regulator
MRLARADEAMGGWLITPMPTQQDLAGRSGTTRDTVARTLSQLTRDGLVQRTGRTLRIPDLAALEAAIARLGTPGADHSS